MRLDFPSEAGRSSSSFQIESLENRMLMHTGPLQVSSVIADNRGEILISMNQPIRASNVNTGAIQMYTAGHDKILGNADDTRVTTALNYQSSGNRIVIRATLPADTGYRVKLVSTRITSADGDTTLDGEYRSATSSGNGVAGGNYEFQTKNDKSATPTTRWSTSAGTMNVLLYTKNAPKSVANFLAYANAGNYDNSFFTRNIPGFIVQGGSLQVNSKNKVVEGPVRAPVVNEFGISNTRGTVAMAKQGGDPNSATNQFFFNLADNSANLDAQNGGFTVFAKVNGSSSLATMDAIAAKQTEDLTSQVGTFTATGTTDVPVNTSYDGTLNPSVDLVTIRRVAKLMVVAKF